MEKLENSSIEVFDFNSSDTSVSLGPSMIRQPTFFKDEEDFPLLSRNHGFVTPENAEDLILRAQKWVNLGETPENVMVIEENKELDDGMHHIFRMDADRTFSKGRHEPLIRALSQIYKHTGNYHQGSGFLTSFFLLFLEEQQTVELVIRLSESMEHCHGYFMSASQKFVTDARILQQLILVHHPELHALFQSKGVIAEAYSTKLFVALGVHFLPFEGLFDFIDAFIEHGRNLLITFFLVYIRDNMEALLKCTSTTGIQKILRNDNDTDVSIQLDVPAILERAILLLNEERMLEDIRDYRVTLAEEVRNQVETAARRMKELEALADEESDDSDYDHMSDIDSDDI